MRPPCAVVPAAYTTGGLVLVLCDLLGCTVFLVGIVMMRGKVWSLGAEAQGTQVRLGPHQRRLWGDSLSSTLVVGVQLEVQAGVPSSLWGIITGTGTTDASPLASCGCFPTVTAGDAKPIRSVGARAATRCSTR